ncbi:hypothetical protein WJ972_06330 [Achromobacter insuavis]
MQRALGNPPLAGARLRLVPGVEGDGDEAEREIRQSHPQRHLQQVGGQAVGREAGKQEQRGVHGRLLAWRWRNRHGIPVRRRQRIRQYPPVSENKKAPFTGLFYLSDTLRGRVAHWRLLISHSVHPLFRISKEKPKAGNRKNSLHNRRASSGIND